ncbi:MULTISPECIES: integrating conjugative element protein [unclassified Pantoea]|uniref:integrating conjugative element protein n=1 Tax=unclassified Pantoea TaxID=2630326 RepID=UPI001CD2F72A|nr:MULTISPECIES: integrating conjugative element protein [unclassified Pantoea]MCA1178337.1 integrating conjugative element protein [Pantoea sp. alder69]MCA1253190.1 integrating conjugative element protein [Pantoea sp. alder70]MCA1266567.1 integrating conjugative element protein [Pantoea sp. alder81]
MNKLMLAGAIAAWPFLSHAELNVIADLGGKSAAPFYEGINAEPQSQQQSIQPDYSEGSVLPVATPELTPGMVEPRALKLPGIGALFVIGEDGQSQEWLSRNAELLSRRGAVGMVVNVSSSASLQQLRQIATNLQLAPVSGSDLARRLKLEHYPVLITEHSLSQQVSAQ